MMPDRSSPETLTVTSRQLHDVIANAISKGRTYSGIQEAVREIQKLYAGLAQCQQGPDYKSCFFDTLKMLHESLDVIEDIDSECLLPPQLQDLVDVALAPRRGQQIEPLPAALTDTSTDRPPTIDDVPSCGQENDYRRADSSPDRGGK